MTLIVKFVDRSGIIQEYFFDLVHVKNTTALTFNEDIFFVLSHYNLDIQNIKGKCMTMLVTCMESEMICKLYSLNIALIHIMYIV